MTDRWIILLTVAAALGSGLMAGFFMAFSVTVMKALGRQPVEQGMAAMQTINVVVLNPWFLSVFFGTAVLCLVLGGRALHDVQEPGAALLMTGSLLYLVGVIAVTMACNVPLNNALARLSPTSHEGIALWKRYLSVWTAWNHVRTVAPLAAAGAFILALRH